jgi:hypothetical protein
MVRIVANVKMLVLLMASNDQEMGMRNRFDMPLQAIMDLLIDGELVPDGESYVLSMA